MTIKGFDYLFAQKQLHEQFHETSAEYPGAPQFIVFCDAISANDTFELSRSSQAAATLAEGTITEYLQSVAAIDEEQLQIAFKKANEKVLELYGDEGAGIAVSGVVMALVPSGKEDGSEVFLVAGVGDARVYRIDRNRAELLFIDPHAPEIGAALGPEARSLALTNAMGLDTHVRVTVRRTEQPTFQRYLLMTYGAYTNLSGEQIHQLGMHPHDPLNGVAPTLNNFQEARHMVRVCTATYEQPSGPQITKETPMLESTRNTPTGGGRKKMMAIALAGAVGVFALTVGLKSNDTQKQAATSATETSMPFDTLPATTDAFAAEDAPAGATEAATPEVAGTLATEHSMRLKAEQQLEQAREELKQFVANQQPTTAAAGQEELNALRHEKRNLAAQVETLKKQVAQVATNQGEQPSHEFTALQERYRTLRDEYASKTAALQAAVEQEKQRTAELENQISRVTEATEGGHGDVINSAQRDALAANLEIEKKARKQAEDALNQKNAQVALLERRLADTSASVNQAVLEAKAEMGQQASNVQKALVTAQARVKELEAFMDDTGGRRGGTRAQRAELQKLKSEVAMLNKQLKENSLMPSEEVATMAKLKQQVADLTTAYRVSSEKVNEVSAAFAQAKQENNNLRAQMTDPTRNMTADARQQINQLQNSLMEAQARSRTLEQTVAALNQAAPEQARQVTELTTRTRDLQNERVKLLQDKTALMQKLAKVDDLQALYEKERAARIASEQALAVAQKNGGAPVARTSPVSAASAIATASTAVAMADTDATAADTQRRVHVVRPGETLSGISIKYFGKANRTDDIFEANRDILHHKNQIRAGMQLVIPVE